MDQGPAMTRSQIVGQPRRAKTNVQIPTSGPLCSAFLSTTLTTLWRGGIEVTVQMDSQVAPYLGGGLEFFFNNAMQLVGMQRARTSEGVRMTASS